jgi:hypothetical protein
MDHGREHAPYPATRRRSVAMTDWDDDIDSPPAEHDDVLDSSDSLLTDDMNDDPLDTGIIPPDKDVSKHLFGLTEAEAKRGPSLDQLLSAEEPDVAPSSVDDRWPQGPSPRSGRLTASDDGSGDDLTCRDVGPDGGAASAEEAAVHLTDLDQDRDAEFDDASGDEPLADAVRYTRLDADSEARRRDDYH